MIHDDSAVQRSEPHTPAQSTNTWHWLTSTKKNEKGLVTGGWKLAFHSLCSGEEKSRLVIQRLHDANHLPLGKKKTTDGSWPKRGKGALKAESGTSK